jgi:hypothetical protein
MSVLVVAVFKLGKVDILWGMIMKLRLFNFSL